MLTPQEIKEKTFEKAVFGGYDMGEVDNFLNDICDDFASMQKENATLKAKLKVLASKIEEYRESEDAMRLTLVTAQKIGTRIESEASEKSERMVAEAEAKAAKLVRDAHLEVANEDARLIEAKRSSAQFLENMRALCTKQLDFFDHLGEMNIVGKVEPAPQTATSDDDTIRVIETNIARNSSQSQQNLDISREIDKIATPEVTVDEPTKPFTPVSTKGFNFDDLQHGDSN